MIFGLKGNIYRLTKTGFIYGFIFTSFLVLFFIFLLCMIAVKGGSVFKVRVHKYSLLFVNTFYQKTIKSN